MTKLNTIRDEMAEKYDDHYHGSPFYDKVTYYKRGWDACAKILMAEAGKLVEALIKIENSKRLFSMFQDSHYVESISNTIKDALTEWRQFTQEHEGKEK